MNDKKKMSEEMLREAIYDAIREAAIECGKPYGVYEVNGEPYYDVCHNPDDALVQFKFDKGFIRDYLYICRFLDDFIDYYYENNVDEIIESIKSESSDKEWDV